MPTKHMAMGNKQQHFAGDDALPPALVYIIQHTVATDCTQQAALRHAVGNQQCVKVIQLPVRSTCKRHQSYIKP